MCETVAIPPAKCSGEKRNEALPTFKLILASLAISLAFATPALAQSNAASGQYTPCPDRPNVGCVNSIEDGVKTVTENAAKSAEASGEALTGGEAGPFDEGASVEKGSSVARAAGIDRLPDTGGASLLIPGVGLLLVATGLLRLKSFR